MGAPPAELKAGLKQRHLTMIAMGGVIGAGLFIGSSQVIKAAGPSAFIPYFITGVMMILIMRMLGEMAVANPSTGAFADYARKAMGGWAGYTMGWLYWYYWVIIVGFEAIAGAEILHFWLPNVPTWVMALILMSIMTATNLLSVKSFGEFEFWFAGIKVVTIVVFIAVAAFFVFGLWPGKDMDFSNLYAHGGFMPNGASPWVATIILVVFAMGGAEVAVIAAAESDNPARAIAVATRSIVFRLLFFFVLSVFLLVVILPWNDPTLGKAPFVAALAHMGIPGAPAIMNAVMLTAVLSVLNSGLYTASRMLFVLAGRREAPVGLMAVGPSGVPRRAILLSSVVGFLCVIAAAIDPEHVFFFMINSIGPVMLIVYIFIAVSQIILRKHTPPEKLTIKMWLHPWLSILVIAGFGAVLVQMLVLPARRIEAILCFAVLGLIIASYFVVRSLNERRAGRVAEPVATPTTPATRVLVLANETVEGKELLEELHRIDAAGKASYYVCVPANPIDTGQAEHSGAVYMWDRTTQAAQERLDRTLATMRSDGLDVDGSLGDYRPLRALANAVTFFKPDRLVISTLAEADSAWLRYDVLDRAKETYPTIPVTHIVAKPHEDIYV